MSTHVSAPALRPLTAMEKRAVQLAAHGVAEPVITLHTRLSPDQVATAVERHQRWEAMKYAPAPRTTAQPPPEPVSPAVAAGPTPLERAVELYAGGMGVNQIGLVTGLTRGEVRTVLGLEAEEPRHLLPAGELPPVLQGVEGSIAGRRPPVVATPKPPAIQPSPKACRRPPRPVLIETSALTPPKFSPAPKPAPNVRSAPAPKPATEPLPAPGTRRWNQLATSPDVRDWAATQGWQLPPPGTRLPGAIILAYHQAHGDAP